MGVFPSIDCFVNCRFFLIRVTAVIFQSITALRSSTDHVCFWGVVPGEKPLPSPWLGKAMWLLRLTSASLRDSSLHMAQGSTNTWEVHSTKSWKNNFFKWSTHYFCAATPCSVQACLLKRFTTVMLKKIPLLLSHRLTFKMQCALVILTSYVYGNKIQTLCESVGEKLSRSLERGDHFLHGFFSRITSEQQSVMIRQAYDFLQLCTIHIPQPGNFGAFVVNGDSRWWKEILDFVDFLQCSTC